MNALVHRKSYIRQRIVNSAALIALLFIGALALIGPSGLLAWWEQDARLESHEQHIAQLQERRAELQNRVDLLDPDNVDPDYASELVRGQMNVVHPDEYLVELEPAE